MSAAAAAAGKRRADELSRAAKRAKGEGGEAEDGAAAAGETTPGAGAAPPPSPAGSIIPYWTGHIDKRFVFVRRIGRPGQYGMAVVAADKETGEERAVKAVSKARLQACSPAEREGLARQLRNEVDVMRKLEHPNIVQFLDVFEDRDYLHIVMELCSGGELFQRISERKKYTEADAAAVLRQVCLAVAYLHDRDIMHGDLKPDNIMFLHPGDRSPVKLIDFGMSKIVRPRHCHSTLCGTLNYMAPEVVGGRYTKHADMWSIGVIMFVMLFGHPPFSGRSHEELFARIRHGFDPRVRPGYGAHFPEAVPASDAARRLVAGLLTADVARRLSVHEALDDPWMRGAPEDEISPSVISSLRGFRRASKFKQGALAVVAGSALDEAQLKRVADTFRKLDDDGDGTITADEMLKAARDGRAGIDEADVQRLIREADMDGDNRLDYNEVLLTAVSFRLAEKEERLWNTFQQLDSDQDHFISAEEVAEHYRVPLAQARDIVAEVDVDGDGRISFDEFVVAMRSEKGREAEEGKRAARGK